MGGIAAERRWLHAGSAERAGTGKGDLDFMMDYPFKRDSSANRVTFSGAPGGPFG